MATSDFDSIYIELLNRQIARIIFIVLAVFLVLVMRLWYLQIVKGPEYRTKSEKNRIRLQDIPPFRGLVYDASGELMVGNRLSYDLLVIPEEVEDSWQLAESLRRMVDLDPQLVTQAVNGASRKYPFRPVCIKRDITRDELAVIETHRFNLPGIVINVAQQRNYLQGCLSSHLLGYLGEIGDNELGSLRYPNSKPGDLIGKAGAEWRWQAELSGTRGGEQVEVDAAGRQIRVISKRPPDPGANVSLTIKKDFQALAERLLAGKRGAIVAMNPADGRILAMASSPSYDPNVFIGGIDKSTWEAIAGSTDFPLHNRVLTGQYPPGSVFKIVMALAGLEEGVIRPEEEITCGGTFTLGTHDYHCWKKYGHGSVDLRKAIVESCDVYFYKLGKKLGIDRISSYAKRFGLGEPTGFDAGWERPGLIPSREWKLKKLGTPWQAGETISASIGQSFVLVTPIQMVVMLSAVFNGGILYQPQVTEAVEKPDGETLYRFEPKVKGTLGIKPSHLAFVRNALVAAVNDPAGTGGQSRLDGIPVAGKTGTAQVVTLEKQKAAKNGADLARYRDHAWFTAIAPADRPRIAVAVFIENGGHGGQAAAPVAKELLSAYLSAEGEGRGPANSSTDTQGTGVAAQPDGSDRNRKPRN